MKDGKKIKVIFDLTHFIMPVNWKNLHWFEIDFNMKTRQILHIDSIKDKEIRKYSELVARKYLEKEYQIRVIDKNLEWKYRYWEPNNWTFVVQETFQQLGHKECGYLTVLNIECTLIGIKNTKTTKISMEQYKIWRCQLLLRMNLGKILSPTQINKLTLKDLEINEDEDEDVDMLSR